MCRKDNRFFERTENEITKKGKTKPSLHNLYANFSISCFMHKY